MGVVKIITKKFISIIIIIMTIIQSIILYLIISDKLSIFQVNIVDIVWIGSALLGILLGFLFFRINKETKTPHNTITTVSLLGLIGFPFMISNNWAVVFLLIVLVFGLHFYRHRDSKFTIFPVISFIMGIYSIGLYILMRGITSM